VSFVFTPFQATKANDRTSFGFLPRFFFGSCEELGGRLDLNLDLDHDLNLLLFFNFSEFELLWMLIGLIRANSERNV
jgi:hypothetical protein